MKDLRSTEAEKIQGEEALKSVAPPPHTQLKRHGAQGRLRVRFVAYGNTINLIEGIFEFQSQS